MHIDKGLAAIGNARHALYAAGPAICVVLGIALSACSIFDTASEPLITPTAISPPSSTATASPNITTPQQVAAEIIRWFTAAGYKRFQAEALADHAAVESGFRPCAVGPRGLRYTFQWGDLRLLRLQKFAGVDRTCPPLAKQLAFADQELRSNPAFACFWQATTRPTALDALRRGFGRGTC